MAYYCFITWAWVHITPMEMKPIKEVINPVEYTRYYELDNGVINQLCDEYNHFGMFFNKNNSYLYVLHVRN